MVPSGRILRRGLSDKGGYRFWRETGGKTGTRGLSCLSVNVRQMLGNTGPLQGAARAVAWPRGLYRKRGLRLDEEIFVLLALAVVVLLAVPVCIVVLLVGQSRLKERVGSLERGLAAARQALLPPAALPLPVVAAAPVLPEPAVETDAVFADAAASEMVPPAMAADQNRPLVMRADRGSALIGWLGSNWVYAVSALSLAMAGVFFVQYGMEHGLLPPTARVVMAILFGAALIAAGEWIRRKGGDGATETTAYLPSVFSGAGLVSIFAGIIAARQLYGLIGPEVAFAGLLATAVLAVVLGWFYGPLLAAVGLLGAAAAPFLVAGSAAPGAWLYGYYGMIAAAGLAVDAVRRWAWVSVLALGLAYGGGYLMLIGGAGLPGWLLLLLALALIAVALPVFRVIPDHPGPTVSEALLHRGKSGWPPFPVRLAAGAGLASALGLLVQAGGSSGEGMLIYAALAALALLYLLWADRAPGLSDLALLPATAFLLRLVIEPFDYWPVAAAFGSKAIAFRPPETAAPLTVTLLLGMAVLISGAAAVRAMPVRAMPVRAIAGGPFRLAFGLAFGLASVLVAPVAAAILELLWAPGLVVGAYLWALQIIALAALMVGLALQFARVDGVDRRRVAYATLSALSLIALALFLITTKSALTMALAVLVVAAAGLDRRFRLPEMGIFVQIGVAVLSYRLLVDPGIGWAMDAGLGTVMLTFTGVIAGLLAAIRLLQPLGRKVPVGVLESAAAGFMAVFANVLISRLLLPQDGSMERHYAVTLNALPWLVMLLVQLYRAGLGGGLRKLRLGIAAVAGLIAGARLLVAAGPSNPLFSYGPEYPEGLVYGPMVLDTLLLAYGVPGLMLLAAAWRFRVLAARLRLGFVGVGAALVALYVGLEIRRFWQGDWLGAGGVMQGELYTYTLALMLLGAGLLYQAIARRSVLLRRIAMAVVGLTVAKVFLLDASGLTGLTRVVSLLGLGLSLAGLAWLNRWAGQVAQEVPPKG